MGSGTLLRTRFQDRTHAGGLSRPGNLILSGYSRLFTPSLRERISKVGVAIAAINKIIGGHPCDFIFLHFGDLVEKYLAWLRSLEQPFTSSENRQQLTMRRSVKAIAEPSVRCWRERAS